MYHIRATFCFSHVCLVFVLLREGGPRGDGRGGSNPSYGQNYASEHNSSIMASAER